MQPLMVSVHALAAVVWVGGMAFALLVLRPSAGPLDPPVRLELWQRVFARFFSWVWAAAVLLPATGLWMIFDRHGGFGGLPVHLHLMHGIGWVMLAVFLYLWFAPHARFKAARAAGEAPAAAAALDRIRKAVTVNLVLGAVNVVIGASGAYWTA